LGLAALEFTLKKFPNRIVVARMGCAITVVGLVAGLFYASQTGRAGGLFQPPIDKFVHVGFWFLCATLGQMASGLRSRSRWWVLMLLLGFASLEEFLQIGLVDRQAEISDAFANATGIVASVFAMAALKKTQAD
jgi:VanZ family protein